MEKAGKHTQRERDLRRERKFLHNMMATIPDSMLILDKNLRIKRANRSFYRLFGADTDATTGRQLDDIVGDADGRLRAELIRLFGTEDVLENLEFRYRSPHFGERVLTARARGMVVAEEEEEEEEEEDLLLIHDVTEHKRLEEVERAAAANRMASQVLEAMAEAVMVTEMDGVILQVNGGFEKATGWTREEAVGQRAVELCLLSQEEVQRIDTVAMPRLMREGSVQGFETTARRKDGSLFPALASGTLMRDEEGRAVRIVGTTIDLSELKQAGEALRESEAKYATLVGHSRDGVVVVQDGKIVFVNQAHAGITGYSVEEMMGKSFLDMVEPAFRETVIRRQKGRAAGEPVEAVIETRIRRKDGTVRFIESSTAPIAYGGRPAVMVMVRDITEKKLLEEERQRAARLESVGSLAGGIAHDFNNLLAGILGNVTLARNLAMPRSEADEMLVEAEKACLRAKGLTQQLLTFAKGGTPVRELASIADVVTDSATFALRGSRVKCHFDLAEDLWAAEIDVGQISQVISNLVINADEAMPGGGTIGVRAVNRVVGPGTALPLRPGDYVEMSVEDNGVGIPPEYLDRVFEPYFTTKQKGSGLGLAVVYSIVKGHEGHILVESKLGVGTTFRIWLPASRKRLRPIAEDKVARPVASAVKRRILAMDDEEMLRNMLRKMLSLAGYEVQTAADGAEAVALYAAARDAGQPFAAVILDLTVPGGMGGREAIDKLLEIDPEVKAIVSSGYSTDPVMSDFRKYGFSAIAVKPYSVEALEETLNLVIGENTEQ